MKKILSIALALMLSLGLVSVMEVTASATDTHIGALPEISENMGSLSATLDGTGLDYYTIWNAFPEEIDQQYEDGVFFVADGGYTDVTFWSYLNYETYQLTLVDGKWRCELPEDVQERGGIVYVYFGEWNTNYRGGTKEATYLEGENSLGVPYKIEVMSHLFRIWTSRYIGDNTYVADAYYTFDGELDYLLVSGYASGYSDIGVYYNAQGQATAASCYDEQWLFMSPDGNWYSDIDFESEICDTPDILVGMSFEEVTALLPCLLNCGDHELSEYHCEYGQYCTICFEIVRGGSTHEWADATCDAPMTCQGCGETQGETIPHEYGDDVTDPTCEGIGYTTYTCIHCGDSYTDHEEESLGHDYSVAVTEPTCKDHGYTTYSCGNCGDTYTDDEVETLEHDWLDATYDAPKTCSLCGETEGEPLESSEESTESEPESETGSETESESETETVTETEPETESETETETESESESETETETETESETEPVTETETETERDPETVLIVLDEDEQEKEKSGCRAAVGSSVLAILAFSGFAGLALMRKREE